MGCISLVSQTVMKKFDSDSYFLLKFVTSVRNMAKFLTIQAHNANPVSPISYQ